MERGVKVALGPHEISCGEKKLGQNSTVQVDRRIFCMSCEFAGGATLIKVTESQLLIAFLYKNLKCWIKTAIPTYSRQLESIYITRKRVRITHWQHPNIDS